MSIGVQVLLQKGSYGEAGLPSPRLSMYGGRRNRLPLCSSVVGPMRLHLAVWASGIHAVTSPWFVSFRMESYHTYDE